ncbi:hypothetical protein [Flavobacterium urocaniciphilum]|uniref:DUF3784 domain-containing protein n=1 Tax=Flavobacterium urocaniciphilum TaxID=1299341 RepID=A0A1H8YWY0_9FLAO|nr:hypothetical protein [Flavobacterium urocaniciphilum]SEP56577.1 hypothetical protein SAMN05444005_101314 [Flavobacterium urocaniciphilum]
MSELNLYFVGLVLLIFSNWYSRYTVQNAVTLLDDNKKVELINLFQKENKFNGLTVIALMIVFFVLIQLKFIPILYLMIGIFTLLITKIVYTYKIKLGKLKANNFPIEYIKKFNLASYIQIGGFLVFSILSILMIAIYA